jgi:hypothetical protein
MPIARSDDGAPAIPMRPAPQADPPRWLDQNPQPAVRVKADSSIRERDHW